MPRCPKVHSLRGPLLLFKGHVVPENFMGRKTKRLTKSRQTNAQDTEPCSSSRVSWGGHTGFKAGVVCLPVSHGVPPHLNPGMYSSNRFSTFKTLLLLKYLNCLEPQTTPNQRKGWCCYSTLTTPAALIQGAGDSPIPLSRSGSRLGPPCKLGSCAK